MKRKLLMLTALALCLALLCGCTTIATSEWMQNLFPVGDEAVAAQQTGSVNGSEDKQEVKQVVTETFTALDSFGLAYQPDYSDKIRLMCRMMRENGYTFIQMEDVVA